MTPARLVCPIFLGLLSFTLPRLYVQAAEAVTLAAQRTARLPIVVSPTAGETTRKVAKELADYLQQMSGAKFEVRTAPADQGIFVGTKQEFPLPDFAKALAIDENHNGVEAFVIHPRKGSLYLVGATETGTSHAVFRLLERLGCRWYFPAKEWEIVPKLDLIAVDFSESDRPRIPARRIWWGYGFFDRARGKCQADYEAWARHNRMAESFRTYTGHAWQTIIADNRAIFEKHPEYLALVGGKRTGPQFCVSNPEVRKLALQWALGRLEKQPALDMVSLETSDGLGHCECKDCVALGNVSERVFGLANEVAREVLRKYPGKMVGMLAYSDHCEPPSFALEPNVYVQSTAGFIRGRYTFEELMELWPRKTRNIGFYHYLSVWPWDFDQLPGGSANDIAGITERFRQYARVGATSITCESSNNWGPHGRGYYVANRLMWNPDADVDALLADFYQTAFGPAAKPMRRFYERFDRGNKPLMSEHLLALGFRDVREASERAKDRPDVRARLDQVKQYLHYVRVKWDLDHLPRNDPKRKELTLDGLTWCYRTRYSYMNHWTAMWQSWTQQAAEEFNQPDWSFRHRGGPIPWASDMPVSSEETSRVFLADLERFRPQDVQEVAYSDKLVWANLDDAAAKAAKPRPLSHRYQRPMRYAIVSKKGEPLAFTIETGVIKHYRDRPNGRWRVTNEAGEGIGSGRLPQDGNKHSIAVKVPKPGLYWIDYNDNSAGWAIEAAPGTPISLALERGERIHHLGQYRDPVFFFVPKGTRTLHLFWEGGNLKPQVFGPDGRLVAEIGDNGKFVGIGVPEGMDGQCWYFKRFAPQRIWFANAPNFLAAAPSELVLPKEVVGR